MTGTSANGAPTCQTLVGDGGTDAPPPSGCALPETSAARHSTRRSMLFVGGIFLAAALAWGGMQLIPASAADQQQVQVIDGTGEQHLYPLDKDGIYAISTDLGTNTIEVNGGEVWMQDSTCPNHDCMEQGHIHNGTGYILCLPNQLMVKITGADTADDNTQNVDTIAS